MPDTSRHDATRPDGLHTLTIRDLEGLLANAGVVMSRRQVLRHCKAGTFDATKLPGLNNVDEWMVAPNSVEKGIADIRVLQEQRLRRDTIRRGMTGVPTSEITSNEHTDTTRQDGTRHDVTEELSKQRIAATSPDASRHDAPDFDVFEHPYVKRLEAQVEKWEGKYLDQVRRTEDIQRDHRKELIELQRMTTVGNSQTLADFMLKAKDWILGPKREDESAEPGSVAQQ